MACKNERKVVLKSLFKMRRGNVRVLVIRRGDRAWEFIANVSSVYEVYEIKELH